MKKNVKNLVDSNKLKELQDLLAIKEKQINSDLDQIKVNNIKFLLEQDDIFFRLKPGTAVGILDYLGIEKEKLYDYYLSLISVEEFRKINKKI